MREFSSQFLDNQPEIECITFHTECMSGENATPNLEHIPKLMLAVIFTMHVRYIIITATPVCIGIGGVGGVSLATVII